MKLSFLRRGSPYSQPAFIGAVIVLLMAAVGLNLAVATLKLHFKKVAVPLARPLAEIPAQLGDWIQVSRDVSLDHDIQEVLGTDEYIFRDYLYAPSHGGECAADLLAEMHSQDGSAKAEQVRGDYLAATPEQRVVMLHRELDDQKKSSALRKQALGMVQARFPDSVINMAVTYYTGMVDTVAHVPDRCYIADGFEPTELFPNYPTWTLGNGLPPLQVRFMNFQDSSGAARIDRSVAYFFHVNGSYACDPVTVRVNLQDLRQKYGYYAKVELMTLDPDHQRSANTMTMFLGSALAEVQKSFPDWKKVTAGQVQTVAAGG